MVTIRHVDGVIAPPASAPSPLRRPSCIPSTQTMAPTAMRTKATTALSPVSGQSRRSVTATVTATESPDRLHASSVRSRARPASLAPPSDAGSALFNVARILFRTNEGEDDGYDCHHSDADGKHQRHRRTRQRLTTPHGPIIGLPVTKAGDGNESTKRNHR